MYQFLAGAVTAETLHTLLQNGSWRWLYAERMEDTALLWLADALQGAVPWMRWQHGRAFDPGSELAWWRQADGQYQVRLLTDGTAPMGIRWESPTEWHPVADTPSTETLLYGLSDGNGRTWSEARIPRHFAYPVEDTPRRVFLTTQTYWQDGQTFLTRLLMVTGDKGGADE